MTVEQIISVICPELADNPSEADFVQMSAESLSDSFFGKMRNYAVAYKACHLYTMFNASGTEAKVAGLGGAITSLSEGGLSVSFASGSIKEKELGSTKYGRMLLDLIKSLPKMSVNRSPLVWSVI